MSADIFARKVEKRLSRLQQRRIDTRIAGARIGADERLGPRVRSVLRRAEPVTHYAIVHIHNRPGTRGGEKIAFRPLLPLGF